MASPQAYGQVERVNKILALIIGKLSDDELGKTWPKIIIDVKFAINNTINTSTSKMLSNFIVWY